MACHQITIFGHLCSRWWIYQVFPLMTASFMIKKYIFIIHVCHKFIVNVLYVIISCGWFEIPYGGPSAIMSGRLTHSVTPSPLWTSMYCSDSAFMYQLNSQCTKFWELAGPNLIFDCFQTWRRLKNQEGRLGCPTGKLAGLANILSAGGLGPALNAKTGQIICWFLAYFHVDYLKLAPHQHLKKCLKSESNPRALKFSYLLVIEIHIFQCMGNIFCVEFQRGTFEIPHHSFSQPPMHLFLHRPLSQLHTLKVS